MNLFEFLFGADPCHAGRFHEPSCAQIKFTLPKSWWKLANTRNINQCRLNLNTSISLQTSQRLFQDFFLEKQHHLQAKKRHIPDFLTGKIWRNISRNFAHFLFLSDVRLLNMKIKKKMKKKREKRRGLYTNF